MNIIWILLVVVYIVTTHFLAVNMGAEREVGVRNTVLLSLLFSPLLTYFIVKASPKINK